MAISKTTKAVKKPKAKLVVKKPKAKLVVKTEPKRGRGQPTKYKPEYCEQLIEYMSEGLSFESFGAEVNVNQDTLHEWAKVHKEFSEAKKRAFTMSLQVWEKKGLAGLFMGYQGGTFNTTLWIFNMKNRFKWTDRSDLKIESDFSEDQEDHDLLRSVDRSELIKLVRKDTKQ